jgi:hypothetical protein
MRSEKLELKCAVCGKQSTQKIVYSSHAFGVKQHLDARADNGSVDVPIQECPHCHYSNANISKENKGAKKIVESATYQNIINSNLDKSAKQYIQAAIINEKERNFASAGNLYLFATWIFEDNKDRKNATKYRKLAYKNLIKFAEEKDEGDTFIQCADLLRKNKEFEKAKELVDKIHYELFQVDADYKNTDEYIVLKNIVDFEDKLIKNKDFADHLVEESVVRMSFVDFNCLFMRYSQNLTSHSDVSIYAPIVYNMKDEYFNAVVKYLKTGEQENLVCGEYSTDMIIKAYWVEKLDYIKAVVILDNIEKANENGCAVFYPYEVE